MFLNLIYTYLSVLVIYDILFIICMLYKVDIKKLKLIFMPRETYYNIFVIIKLLS